jgi:FkbM family methyltransferase
MTGVLVEANADLLDILRKTRPADHIEHCAVVADDSETVDFFISNQSELSSLSKTFVEEWRQGEIGLKKVVKVPARRVNSLLEKHFDASPPVFLAVDVEGLDLRILMDVDWQTWRPVVVQAEPSDHFEQGQSTRITEFMDGQGYVLIARTAVNLIFVDRRTLPSDALQPVLRPTQSEFRATEVPSGPSGYKEDVSVGIVMRTKNRQVLLRRALESVKRQSYPHWQLVIVNDGGAPEPVMALVDAVFSGDQRVSVIHHSVSVGMEGASNAGLAKLETDLATIHDDDDSWSPDMLAVTTRILRQRHAKMPSIRGIVSRINFVEEVVTGNLIEINSISIWNDHSSDRLREGLISLSRLTVQNLFAPIGFVFDLAIARELGGFDDKLPVLGDWDFNLRFCMDHDIWVHPEALAFYHIRRSATGDLGNTVIAKKSQHELYDRYLRNRSLRNAADLGLAALIMNLPEHMQHSGVVANVPPVVSGERMAGKKTKSGFKAFLSDLNRKRKALRNRGAGK